MSRVFSCVRQKKMALLAAEWDHRCARKNVALWTKKKMTSIIDQTVGGLSIAILLTLVVFAYGYPQATKDEKESKAPFGDESRLFWNIFVGLTTVVLVLVVVVGFLVPCGGHGGGGRAAVVRVVRPQDVSFMSTGSGFSSLGSLGGGDKSALETPSAFSTLSKSANDSFSFSSLSDVASEDISTSLKALSESSMSLSI